jgi:hypothetical protein
MKAFTAAIVAIGLAMTAVPAMAQAGPFDHYKCYKMRDSAKFQARVDLNAFQTQFNVDPLCEVNGRGKLFCVPVQKTVLALSYPSGSTLSPISMPGQDLLEDRICYRVKCPSPAASIQPEEVQDQFGKRKIGKFKVSYLCTNAIKTSSITTTTTTTLPEVCDLTAAGVCGGPCPDINEECKLLAGTNDCECQPIQDLVCEDGMSGQSPGQCGGSCPSGFACDDDIGGLPCRCYPTFPCGDSQDVNCQGFCSSGVNASCGIDPIQGCICQ